MRGNLLSHVAPTTRVPGTHTSRPPPLAGVVAFGKTQAPEELLNGWAGNISKLLDLVEKSCQQIQKECMRAGVTLA